MTDEKRIIEVGGVKLEVDLRYAKQIESYKVGDNVKVLLKEYSDTFKSYPGVIVGFDNFVQRPTIVIAYLNMGYDKAEVKFLYLTVDSKDAEICPMIGDELAVNKISAVQMLDRDIERKEQELQELKRRKDYFLQNFGRYFEKP